MRANAKSIGALLYLSDWDTNDVNVYDYSNGTAMGRLTGFSDPYGQCVDAKGDVYIADFGDLKVLEYARGGSKAIASYKAGGYPIGCSVDAQGDLAITNFQTSAGAGDICVWKHGSQKATCYSDGGSCYYLWPAGYDNKGDLVVVAKGYSGAEIVTCGVPSGSSSMTALSYDGTIEFAGGVTWDGEYLLIPDEIYEAITTSLARVTLSGSTLTYVSETTLESSCPNESVEVTMPFVVGRKNTPVNDKQGKSLVGSTVYCDSGIGIVIWNYPAGGDWTRNYFLGYAFGESVSLAK
jgi:hypothetical protein